MVSHRERDLISEDLGGASARRSDDGGVRRPTQNAPPRAASEVALRRLARRNVRAGHENHGFLSAERGFLPRTAPLTRLDPRFSAWDELAAELPALHQSLSLRRHVEALPLLDASPASLPERELLRASALLAILAHAYWYVDSRPPSALPEGLARPWAQVRARLGRQQEVISYVDLIVYNWRVRDPRLAEPLVVENLDLLFPTVGNQEERVFYLTQVEILARTSPVVRMVAAAQGAVLRRDHEELEAALYGLIHCLGRMLSGALPKIDPNPYGKTHVDPVIWAKTVAPFAVPIHRGDQGPSGTSSPLFNTLDIFFGRRDFSSFLGREIKQLRGGYPPYWQIFLRALGRVSVARYVAQHGSRALRGAFQEAFELYAAETGFLGRHRMKVYGFLELAFKVGRAVTIGGFGGVFTDRTWDLVDDALAESQSERTRQLPNAVHRARVLSIEPSEAVPDAGVRRVTLDIGQAGLRYRTGDRCLILPENAPALVERTLQALGRSGDEPVQLTDEWRAAAVNRAELAGRSEIPLRELLRFGSIRPVSPRLAEALHARTQSPLLLAAIARGATERWELWELLEHLRAAGVTCELLGSAARERPAEALARLIPPQRFRVYSVSSAPRSPLRRTEHTLELTIGQLRYVAVDAPPGDANMAREGTGSSFLTRAFADGLEVPFRLEHPEVFRLPDDPTTPIVMFAGGSGIAPFRAFLEERRRSSRSGASWLLLSMRTPADFLFPDELARAVAAGLRVDIAFTRAGGQATVDADGRLRMRSSTPCRIDDLMRTPEAAARLYQLARSVERGGAGASFYICGRGGFADSVLQTLKQVFAQCDPDVRGAQERAAHTLYCMAGERRLIQEVHTDAQPVVESPRLFDVSEIAEHNDAERGYWIVIDRVVYDMTEFIELHPGGRRVVQAYAGMDATHGFARAHYGRADVDAMRETYRIGLVRALSFDDHVVRVETPSGQLAVDSSAAYRAYAKALQLVVEMQNALTADQSLHVRGAGDRALRTPYVLLRGLETHRRFLKNCLAALCAETLPELWRLGRGLFFPSEPDDWMVRTLERIARSPSAQVVARIAQHAFDEFEAHGDPALAELDQLIDAVSVRDVWFLRTLKSALLRCVRAFERHGPDVRQRGAWQIRCGTRRAACAVRAYFALAESARTRPAARTRAPLPIDLARAVRQPRRLHTGVYWSLEEQVGERIAILRRTPTPVLSLPELIAENERVLECLRPHHAAVGLVVDMRQARLRNDAGFEDAMARLRRELTRRFRRLAVLLESRIGELQVSRIERDERRNAIATRSESTAFKFAQGADEL